jgi:hypothetical protein
LPRSPFTNEEHHFRRRRRAAGQQRALSWSAAEIVREKGTNRSAFFRGQVDKYTWVDVGSSYLPGEIIAAFLWAQMEEADAITKAPDGDVERLPPVVRGCGTRRASCAGRSCPRIACTTPTCTTSCCPT